MTISAGIFRREASGGKWKSRIQGNQVCWMNDFSAELHYRQNRYEGRAETHDESVLMD